MYVYVCVTECVCLCVEKIGKKVFKIVIIYSLNIRIIGNLNFLLCAFLYFPHFENEHVLL